MSNILALTSNNLKDTITVRKLGVNFKTALIISSIRNTTYLLGFLSPCKII
jgi:hypothetical protein